MLTRLLVILSLLMAGAAHATDCSGTIATGGTAQPVSAVNGNVRKLMLMNNSANLMCFSITGLAATIAGTNCGAGSYALQPGSGTLAGGSFYTDANGPVVSALSIVSSGTGDRFSCERQ